MARPEVKRGSAVVAFCDPGQWAACFGLSYVNLMLYDAGHNARMFAGGCGQIRLLTGTGALVEHRNRIARDFLDATTAEWLFMVDADMGFTEDTVDRLIASADRYHRPVMGGLCFQLRRKPGGELFGERNAISPTVFEYLNLADEAGFRAIADYPRDQVAQVDGTGAACLLVHRGALSKVRTAHGDNWFTPVTHATGNRGKPRTFSEDLSFCVRLAGLGIPVHVDTSVKTTHDKGGVFLDEAEYDRYRLTEAAVAAAEQATAPAELATGELVAS